MPSADGANRLMAKGSVQYGYDASGRQLHCNHTTEVSLLNAEGRRIRGLRTLVAQLLPAERRNVVVQLLLTATEADVALSDARLDASVVEPLRWRRVGAVPLSTVQLLRSGQLPGNPSVAGLNVVYPDFIPADRTIRDVPVPRANAAITNPLDAYVAGIVFAAVAFDKEGRIIGGGQNNPLNLAPHQPASWSMTMVVTPGIAAIARIEVTAAYPYIDLTPYAR